MSKFIDKLKQLSQPTPEPIGFHARAAALPKPKIQLIAMMDPDDVEKLSADAAGADTALVSLAKPTAKILQKISQAFSDSIWGVALKGTDVEEVKKIIKIGADFVVFPPAGTPVKLIDKDEKTGKILSVNASLTEGMMRTINDLPVDAVMIEPGDKSEFLSWQDLMSFRRFSVFLSKPLLVPVPAILTEAEFTLLWEAGVDGIVVEATEQTDGSIKELRETIDKMTFPLPRRREKMSAVLPRLGGASAPAHEEEEEEED